MAAKNFPVTLAFVLESEGGFVNDPHDPGGATNRGITIATFRHYQPDATIDDLRHISDADVAAIYHTGYWNAVHGDDLPDGVDLMAVDFGVNAGPGRAIKMLQRAVGATVDGLFGPRTLAAVGGVPGLTLIDLLDEQYRDYYKSLSTFARFGRGWLRRCDERLASARQIAGGNGDGA